MLLYISVEADVYIYTLNFFQEIGESKAVGLYIL
jgi:hypothetical protein